MVAEQKPEHDPTYNERVAAAQASLERDIAEHRQRIAEWEAEHGDPAVALHAYVREHFDRDALLQAWREWRAERGKTEIEGW